MNVSKTNEHPWLNQHNQTLWQSNVIKNHHYNTVSILCSFVDYLEVNAAYRTYLKTVFSFFAQFNLLCKVFFYSKLKLVTWKLSGVVCFLPWLDSVLKANTGSSSVVMDYTKLAELTICCNTKAERKESGQCFISSSVSCRKSYHIIVRSKHNPVIKKMKYHIILSQPLL